MARAGADEEGMALLRTEHRKITRQLELLAGSTRPGADPAALKRISADLGSLLEKNLTNEKQILYGPLKEKLQRDKLVASMVEAQGAIRREFKDLSPALAKYETGVGEIQDLRSRVASLQKLTADYIRKEEKIVFWYAELHL